ncbi:hypothetical protein GCM10009808_09410 [Microbacterium sediminicola]|uniref:GGDEF domain-containing protein n=1 Tax=Microbacterium sediminicola TaxID=415210 RepID=A0ABP4TV01_9MICO
MQLDLFSVSVMTATVVIVTGIVYVVDTLVRRDESSGRHWSLGFLAGIITTLAYALWAAGDHTWITIAIGNVAFLASVGFVWLGSRKFNERPMASAYMVLTVLAVIVFAAVPLSGDIDGGWAGAAWLYAALIIVLSAGAFEALTGDMARLRTTVALAVVLIVAALYTLIRLITFLTLGPGDPVFDQWFSTIPSSFVTITLVIISAIITSVLRAGRAAARGYAHIGSADGFDRVLSARHFASTVADVAERSEETGLIVGVVTIRLDDLENIAAAFGGDTARRVALAARGAVRSTVTPLAVVGEDGGSSLRVCSTFTVAGDARQKAKRLAAAVLDALGRAQNAVMPIVGVGVAVSADFGYDAQALIAAADTAAAASTARADSSVQVATTDASRTTVLPIDAGQPLIDPTVTEG